MADAVPEWMQKGMEDPHPPVPSPPPIVTNVTPRGMAPERADLLARIRPVHEFSGPFKGLIYGPKGTGKTVFCCRARNCILIAAEPGQKSLLNHPELKNVPVLGVKTFNDLDEIAWAKRDGDLDELMASRGLGPVETFIIDTVSEMAIKTASELLDKAYAKNQSRDRFMVSQAEYRVRNELFRRMTADYVDLGVNFIMTAHESEIKDEADGRMYLRPDLSDAMAGSIGGLVDLQGRLTAEEGDQEGQYVRRLQVHPSRRVDAKTRIKLPMFIENPNIQELIDASQRADDERVPEGEVA